MVNITKLSHAIVTANKMLPIWFPYAQFFPGSRSRKRRLEVIFGQCRYKDSFGDDYFSFYKHGCAFLVLQSQFYEDASLVQEQYRYGTL